MEIAHGLLTSLAKAEGRSTKVRDKLGRAPEAKLLSSLRENVWYVRRPERASSTSLFPTVFTICLRYVSRGSRLRRMQPITLWNTTYFTKKFQGTVKANVYPTTACNP